MFYELLKNCSKTCSFSVKNTGEFNFVNNNRCLSCVFNFEKTVCLGEESKKLSFNEFKELIKFIEENKYNVHKRDCSFLFVNKKKTNSEVDEICLFLVFCIENDIHKEYCIKKLKFKLNKEFFNVSKSNKSK